MRRYLLALLCLLALLPGPGPGSAAADSAPAGPVLYVSPQGDDAGPGTEHAPLQTLEAAVSRLRGDRSGGTATLWLAGGTYRLMETLALDYRDRDGIAFRALPGHTPVITGDLPVEGWAPAVLCGTPVLQAAVDAKAVRALYGPSGRLQNARWPKEGMLTVDRPAIQSSALFSNQRAFYADPAALPAALDGAIVRLFHWWKDELSGVRSYDAQTGAIRLRRNTSMTIRTDDRFWLENVLHAPLLPGEWAMDAALGTLYYAPMDADMPADPAASPPALSYGALERLITLDGIDDITFDGITFARTGWDIPLRDSGVDFPQAAFDAGSALFIRNARGITFTQCAFEDIGAGCIRLDAGVRDVAIEGCRFEGIGAQALYIRGRNVREGEGATGRIRIEDNHINGYGLNLRNAPAILIIHAGDMDIRHNEIHGGTYTAISAGWVWGTGFSATDGLRIEYNLLYDIGRGLLADMGAIYTLGVQKHTVIRGNVIYNVQAAEYGGWGIYLDEGASGITVENNLAYGCSSQGFHQHDGVHNTVRNNIFAYNLQGQVGTTDKRDRGTFLLDANLLVGTEPFFWRKYDKETIELGYNLFYTDAAPFAQLEGAQFTLADDGAFATVGFVPWENLAGRRDAER